MLLVQLIRNTIYKPIGQSEIELNAIYTYFNDSKVIFNLDMISLVGCEKGCPIHFHGLVSNTIDTTRY